MESGKAHEKELQKELNDYKEKYFNLQIKQNEAKKKVQELEWKMQQHSGSSTEINELREYIKKIEPQLIEYQKQIQQLVNELNQTKHNAEVSTQGLMAHNRILGEKNNELEGLKQRYSELEKQYIDLKEEYDSAGEQFDKRVNKAANNKAMMMSHEKDQEIQGLQEQLNQFLSQQGAQKTEMEEEMPKIKT